MIDQPLIEGTSSIRISLPSAELNSCSGDPSLYIQQADEMTGGERTTRHAEISKPAAAEIIETVR